MEYFVNEQSRPQKPRGTLPLAGAVISPSDEDSHTFTVNAISGEQYKLRGKTHTIVCLSHSPIKTAKTTPTRVSCCMSCLLQDMYGLHFSTMLLYPQCISQLLDRQDAHIVTVRLLDQDFRKWRQHVKRYPRSERDNVVVIDPCRDSLGCTVMSSHCSGNKLKKTGRNRNALTEHIQ